MSLAELLVTMVILSALGALLVPALGGAQRAEKDTGEDSRALADLRVAMDRFTREVRQARLVFPAANGSNATTAYIWVDYDIDNQQDPAEKIKWRVVDQGGGRAHLLRDSDAGTSELITDLALQGDAFVYAPALPGVPTTVEATFRADAVIGPRPGPREVRTIVRMRNAAGSVSP